MRWLLFAMGWISVQAVSAQVPVDTVSGQEDVKWLEEVKLRAFEQSGKARNSVATVRYIQPQSTIWNNKTSFVTAFNTIAGVRMEERSPGSYRINLRGSSLRSPFGVRNVKVYWNDIPITDPGGNTYFNQFSPHIVSSIELVKGPASSMYGAGTGGLMLVQSMERFKPGLSLEYMTGSYGLNNVFLTGQFGRKGKTQDSLPWQNQTQLTYAHNETDGYRHQSRMRRDQLSWESKFNLSDRQMIRTSVLFTDMYYQTPGGLTYNEFLANPRAARPAAGAFPSAEGARAAIFQKTFTAGMTHEYLIRKNFQNRTTLYGSFAEVRNAAIRNYERRQEPGWGGRTVFTWNKVKGMERIRLVAGAEFQKGYFNTQVFSNKSGEPDTLQTNDDIRYTTYHFFVQGSYDFASVLTLLAGVGLNRTDVGFTRLSSRPIWAVKKSYQNEWAPRISVLKKWENGLSITGTLSRGFSPPTLAELLPSTGVISTDLNAEYGWNRELNMRYGFFRNRLYVDVTGFSFTLQKALVQRRDLSGADYFVNAGQVKQRGLELQLDHLVLFNDRSFFDYIQTRAAFAYSHFRYGDFVQGPNDFSGKIVPSVPSQTYSVVTDWITRKGFYLGLQFYAASKIYLNDANTALAAPYQIAGGRLGWKSSKKKFRLDIYAGVDNLFDETYSLGNDINAAGSRYFNVAYGRNLFFGILFNPLTGRND